MASLRVGHGGSANEIFLAWLLALQGDPSQLGTARREGDSNEKRSANGWQAARGPGCEQEDQPSEGWPASGVRFCSLKIMVGIL